MGLFGRTKTPKEVMNENVRALKSAGRGIDRERVKVENDTKKIEIEIKNAAKKGLHDIGKIKTKDMVRMRNQVKRMHVMKANLQSVEYNMKSMQTTDQMAQAMRNCTKAMGNMNRQMNVQGMNKVMMDFEKETDTMNLKSELMEDAIENVMEDSNEAEDVELAYSQILSELNLAVGSTMASAPMGMAAAATQQETSQDANKAAPTPALEGDVAGDSLQARLDALRKP